MISCSSDTIMRAIQQAGYPVTPQELDKSRNNPPSSREEASSKASQMSHTPGVDSMPKGNTVPGVTNSVHMGVVSQAYSIGQREASPPGQVNVSSHPCCYLLL